VVFAAFLLFIPLLLKMLQGKRKGIKVPTIKNMGTAVGFRAFFF
jgi:hypothetical protein